jgi:uncharacterized protein (UPF0264 family)
MEGKSMARKKSTKAKQLIAAQDMVETIEKLVGQFKAENPDVDINEILLEHKELKSVFEHVRNQELAKFTAYAKEQGTRMSFSEMEMGILAAGRKDMQNSLAELAESLKFDTPVCSEDGTNMRDCGLVKKKS